MKNISVYVEELYKRSICKTSSFLKSVNRFLLYNILRLLCQNDKNKSYLTSTNVKVRMYRNTVTDVTLEHLICMAEFEACPRESENQCKLE